MPSFREIIEFRKEHGLLKLTGKGLKIAGTRMRRLIFAQHKIVMGWEILDKEISPAEARIPITLEKAKLEHIPELVKMKKGFKAKDFKKWIEKDFVFHVGRANGRIVSFGCHCPAGEFKGQEKKFCDIKDDDAWGLECYTLPEFRGKKIYPAILSLNKRIVKARGFKRIIGTTGWNNEASRKVHQISELGTASKVLCFRRVLGFKKYWEEKTKNER